MYRTVAEQIWKCVGLTFVINNDWNLELLKRCQLSLLTDITGTSVRKQHNTIALIPVSLSTV